MSSESQQILPARFAAALKDLPLSSLHLKAAEIRNSIAHLDYSNEQLKPFAEGREGSSPGEPDQDCVDAIRENCLVIERMKERLTLLKSEVELRGSSWLEFQSAEELSQAGPNPSNGISGEEDQRSEAWTDGTFTTGRLVNGEATLDVSTQQHASAAPSSTGGRIDDEALRRAVEERMRAMGGADSDEEGMHL